MRERNEFLTGNELQRKLESLPQVDLSEPYNVFEIAEIRSINNSYHPSRVVYVAGRRKNKLVCSSLSREGKEKTRVLCSSILSPDLGAAVIVKIEFAELKGYRTL